MQHTQGDIPSEGVDGGGEMGKKRQSKKQKTKTVYHSIVPNHSEPVSRKNIRIFVDILDSYLGRGRDSQSSSHAAFHRQ